MYERRDEKARAEYMLPDNWPNHHLRKTRTSLNTCWSPFQENIQRGENIIGKHDYWNRPHGQVYEKYLLYGMAAQAIFFNTKRCPLDRNRGQSGLSYRIVTARKKLYDNNDNRGAEMETTVRLRVAKQTSVKPNSIRKVLVISKEKGLIYFKNDKYLAQLE